MHACICIDMFTNKVEYSLKNGHENFRVLPPPATF